MYVQSVIFSALLFGVELFIKGTFEFVAQKHISACYTLTQILFTIIHQMIETN